MLEKHFQPKLYLQFVPSNYSCYLALSEKILPQKISRKMGIKMQPQVRFSQTICSQLKSAGISTLRLPFNLPTN